MDNFKKVQVVLGVILLANWGVAAMKIVMGGIINSASMTADGFHSITDGTSNVVGLVGIWLASKPVDDDHPYGHKKFETIVGLFIGAMLFVLAGKIITSAIAAFAHPRLPEVSGFSLVVLVITLLINVFVATYEYRAGKRLKSDILVSDSMHTRSDIYVTIGVLFTLIGLKLGLPAVIDPIASLVVAGFILYAGYEISAATCGILLDKVAINPAQISEVVFSFPQVRDIHKIRSRGRDDDVFVDMHILTDPEMSVQESHQLVHDIEAKLMEICAKDVSLIAHIEPMLDDDAPGKKDKE